MMKLILKNKEPVLLPSEALALKQTLERIQDEFINNIVVYIPSHIDYEVIDDGSPLETIDCVFNDQQCSFVRWVDTDYPVPGGKNIKQTLGIIMMPDGSIKYAKPTSIRFGFLEDDELSKMELKETIKSNVASSNMAGKIMSLCKKIDVHSEKEFVSKMEELLSQDGVGPKTKEYITELCNVMTKRMEDKHGI